MSRFKDDPRVITARFNSTCPETGKAIKRGDDIVYYPRERKAYHMDSKAADNLRSLEVSAGLCLGDADW